MIPDLLTNDRNAILRKIDVTHPSRWSDLMRKLTLQAVRTLLKTVDLKRCVRVETVPGGEIEQSMHRRIIILPSYPLEHKNDESQTDMEDWERARAIEEEQVVLLEVKAMCLKNIEFRPGPLNDLLNEIDRNLVDAISVARNVVFNPTRAPGGSATEAARMLLRVRDVVQAARKDREQGGGAEE
ncbi:T-complex protein 1 subunit gamma [Leucoagaricus sp. SymC.cos]|nr:T-complex protein 1 subunit gamma [Leucoagaricus sp. SymC.cos]